MRLLGVVNKGSVRQNSNMQKSAKLKKVHALVCVSILAIFFSGCRSYDTAVNRRDVQDSPTKLKPKAYDLKTVCPEGPTVECYSRQLRQAKEGKLDGIEQVIRALCKVESPDPKVVEYRQAVCFTEANLLAANGNDREAKVRREMACDLNSKFCIERQSRSYSPDFHEVFDLAPRFCAPGAVPRGSLTKFFLERLCSLKVDHGESKKLEKAWIEQQEQVFSGMLSEVKSIQSAQQGKKADFDFTAASESTISGFYLSLKSRKLPVRVSFELYNISAVAWPMDYWPGSMLSPKERPMPEGENVRLPKLPLSGFSGTTEQGWMAGFSGYAAVLPNDLFTLSRRLPMWRSPMFKRKVTATVIGYRETGVIPVPVIVLDR